MWPVQYEVCTARYNYTRRDGTKVGMVRDLMYCTAPCYRKDHCGRPVHIRPHFNASTRQRPGFTKETLKKRSNEGIKRRPCCSLCQDIYSMYLYSMFVQDKYPREGEELRLGLIEIAVSE